MGANYGNRAQIQCDGVHHSGRIVRKSISDCECDETSKIKSHNQLFRGVACSRGHAGGHLGNVLQREHGSHRWKMAIRIFHVRRME